jgi:hypothetical protein
MTTLLDSLSDYMVLTLKKWLYKKSDHETINELKYTISAQKVVVPIMRLISSRGP